MEKLFSSYPLKTAANLTSSYSWRFYELLVSWAQDKKDTGGVLAGWMTVSVDELRKMLMVPDSYTWNLFERQVLKVVTDELLQKSNLHITIERRKTSRKITHLKIEFIQDDNKTSDKKFVEGINSL